jgi:hypothetical protein
MYEVSKFKGTERQQFKRRIKSWKFNPDGEFSNFIDVSDEVNDLLISLIKDHGFTLQKNGGSYGYMQKKQHQTGDLIFTF